MTIELRAVLRSSAAVVGLLLLSACASTAPASGSSAAADDSLSALACTLPTNCVNSLANSSLAPLRYQGSAAQALVLLRATLAQFPEAEITSADDLSVAAVFTTPAGFKDLVDFRIDVPAQRIDFRSRSSFGLFDFGKNRSRMEAFTARFEQPATR